MEVRQTKIAAPTAMPLAWLKMNIFILNGRLAQLQYAVGGMNRGGRGGGRSDSQMKEF